MLKQIRTLIFILACFSLFGCHSKLFDSTPNAPKIPDGAAQYDGRRDVWQEWNGHAWVDVTLDQLKIDHPEIF